MPWRWRLKPNTPRTIDMRVVLDTNVYVSFLLTRGATISHILDAWEEDTFTLLISPQMLVEIRRVIEYPHLKARIKPHEAKALLEALENDAVMLEGKLALTGVTPDPKDDMVIACGVEGKADYVVSGDPHLLKIKQYTGVQIVSPAEFVQVLSDSGNDTVSPIEHIR
jgi:putative PIN family toxin of toxin-antitoxin system